MRIRRARLPVLAEIAGPAAVEGCAWSLRRADYDQVAALLGRLDARGAVLVTGAGDAAGAVAIALAGVATASGRRVALLDCDLGRPRLAADLGVAPAPGLHEYLRWEAGPRELLQPLALAGAASGETREPLVFVAAGRPAADPAILLGLRSFGHMAEKLRHAYELTVIAGPPLSAEPQELRPVADQADAVLVAVAPGQRKGRPGRALAAALAELSAPALGRVVVDPQR